MKVSLWLGLLAWLTLTNPAHAELGDGTRGGGAQIEAAFRLRAIELIQSVANSSEADRICPAETMSKGIQATKIAIVDELVDPDTGKPLNGRNLDAWASPGLLQLLRNTWAAYLDPFKNGSPKSVDALVLHEVYRTTGGRCSDDDFLISSRVMGLLSMPTKFAQIFAITGSQPNLFLFGSDNERKCFIFCDGKLEAGAAVTCAFLWPKSDRQQDYEFRLVRGTVELTPQGAFLREKFNLMMRPLLVAEFTQLVNLLNFATAASPFYVVFDLQYGRWSYGFDLSNLIKLP
jgi:hypothetical protein